MQSKKSAYKRFFRPSSEKSAGSNDIIPEKPVHTPPQGTINIPINISVNQLPQPIGNNPIGNVSEEKKEEEYGEHKDEGHIEDNEEDHIEDNEDKEEDHIEDNEEDHIEEYDEEHEKEDEEIPLNPILYEKADFSTAKSEQGEQGEQIEKEGEQKEEEQKEEQIEKREEPVSDEIIELLQENPIKKGEYHIKENLSPYPGEMKEGKTTIYLCMYSVVQDSYKPFVQYLLCLSNNEYDFPQYEPAAEQLDEEKWLDDFKTQFFNIFPDKMAKYFMPDMEDYYQGIIEEEYESSLKIFLFFDISTIPIQLLQNNPFGKSLIPDNYVLSPIHEFYNIRSIGNTPVNHHIEDLFYTRNYLLDIREHRTQEPIKYPYVLFLCEKESGFFGGSSYRNCLKTSSPDSYSILLPKISNEKLGEFYYFTSAPIDTASTANLRRFAVFIDEESTLFIDKGKEESMVDNLYDSDTESYKFIYMYDSDIQFWIVKSLLHITEL
jgi:hypothetical protein